MSTVARTAAITLLLETLAFFTTRCDTRRVSAQVPPSRTTETAGVICECAFDVSGSLDAAWSNAAKSKAAESLETFLETFGCTILRVYLFSNDGGFAPSSEWAIRPKAANVKKAADLDVSLKYLRSAADHDQQVKGQQQSDDLARARIARAEVAAAAKAWLDAHATPKAVACTGLRSFISAIDARVNPGAVTVIYTDGDDSCTRPTTALRPSHPIIFQVVPKKGDITATGPDALETARHLQELYPGAVAIPSFELDDPELWSGLRSRVMQGDHQ